AKGKVLKSSAPGVTAQLTPGVGTSRVLFKLDADDSALAMPGANGQWSVSYANGSFRAVGAVQAVIDAFAPPKKGLFVDPPLNVVSVVATVKGTGKDKLVLKAAFSAATGAPDNAPEVHVGFGPLDFRVK